MSDKDRKTNAASRMTWSPSDLVVTKPTKVSNSDDKRRTRIAEAAKRLKD